MLAACSSQRVDDKPDTVVRELVEHLRGPVADPARLKSAYALLSKGAQENLQTRAERYTAASGKAIAPEAMLAPPGTSLPFEPRSYRVVRADAASADVEISGLVEEERVVVHCVREGNAWRVELSLPPLAPMQFRPGTRR